MKVSLADLNLDNPAGAKAALNRIQAAARLVCGGEVDQRDLAQYRLQAACVAQSMNRAMADLGSPMVMAAKAGSGPRPVQEAANGR